MHEAIPEEGSPGGHVDDGSKILPALIDDVRQAGGAVLPFKRTL